MLRPCPGCARHVRVTSTSCPFCGAEARASPTRSSSGDEPAPDVDARPSRAAIVTAPLVGVAVLAAAALLGSACSLYGGPPLPLHDAGADASDRDSR